MGTSGAGKTTLMDVLAGRKTGMLIAPSSAVWTGVWHFRSDRLLLPSTQARHADALARLQYSTNCFLHPHIKSFRWIPCNRICALPERGVPKSSKIKSCKGCLIDLHIVFTSAATSSQAEVRQALAW